MRRAVRAQEALVASLGPARSVSETMSVRPDLARQVVEAAGALPARAPDETRRPARAWERWGLRLIYGGLDDPALRVALWDGSSLGPVPDAAAAGVTVTPVDPVATLTIRDRRTLLRLLTNPDLGFGDAYTAGRLTVAGDLVTIVARQFERHRWSASIGDTLRRVLTRSNTLGRARDNIHRHYDIGNDFYRLWLDDDLVYTCAYFPGPDVSLEAAQHAKLDLICRKLRLRPGETVVEAGCGWGALARFMAAHYGVRVRAFNISAEQIAYARRRAAEDGLGDRVEFVEDDYRNITGTYDAFVSIGMLEHVGLDQYGAFGALIQRTLAPRHGRGLLHFIGRDRPFALHPWIERRIFPGAYPPSLAEVCTRLLEPNTFSVLDIENLRLHYARTLRHWLARFDAAADRVAEMFDEAFVRAWRLYLAGSVAGFEVGSMQLFQITFAREENNDVPWTRAYLYPADDAAPARRIDA